MYGRRRIGKSTLLHGLCVGRGGFYWEATRGEPSIQLGRLGEALGAHLGVGRLQFDGWAEAFEALLRQWPDRVPVVLDEFGYVLEADGTVDSALAACLGPAARSARESRTRLLLCGSAIAVLKGLTSGESPLRGRAGLELIVQPHDYRSAARWLPADAGLETAARLYSVIGGVIGYATDMVDHDLPSGPGDFDRWIAARVLSPAATLHREAVTLLAEDPTLAAARPGIHHSILGAIANGSVTAGAIANRLRRSVSALDPALRRLVDAGFVVRHVDPLRDRRPLYALADPFLQFHYAVLEPHAGLLRDRDPAGVWDGRLRAVFESAVRGPVFEEQARTWLRRFAPPDVTGGQADTVGPGMVTFEGVEYQLDVIAAEAHSGVPASERRVMALGEAKSGEEVGVRHLRHLEAARAALGPRAASARLLLFAVRFSTAVQAEARRRADIELVDMERLYG